MEDSNIFEEAGRYLKGELSEEEKKKIDERLEHDKEYAKGFSKFIMMKNLLRENKKAEFISEFDNVEEKKMDIGMNKEFIRLFTYAISILLIGLLAYYLWNSQNSKSNDIPINKEVASFDGLINSLKQESIGLLKKQKNKASSGVNEFIRIYDENKFKEALQFATAELEKSDDDNHWKWQERQGFCYWELEELNQADKIFEKLNTDKILLTRFNPAKWYQALISLELGNKERAKILLQKIISIDEKGEGHQYKDKAIYLLDRLNKSN